MKTTSTYILAAIFALTFACSASAQIVGSVNIASITPASFTSTTFTPASTDISLQEFSGFPFAVSPDSFFTGYSTQLTGLSSTPTSEDIADFFVLPNSVTPADTFTFTLLSITETDPVFGQFTGTGTLSETGVADSAVAATFNLGFSTANADNYSLNLAATPEPSSWALALLCIGLFAYLRRRAVRA
jgi:hypothetical protein